MYFKTYNFITGKILDITDSIDLGDILQNQHSVQPVVFRVFSEDPENVTSLKLYLEDKGSWDDSEFGFYSTENFTPSIESGDSVFKHLTLTPNAQPSSPNGEIIGWNGTNSYYVWVDVQIDRNVGSTKANYRLFYDFT